MKTGSKQTSRQNSSLPQSSAKHFHLKIHLKTNAATIKNSPFSFKK